MILRSIATVRSYAWKSGFRLYATATSPRGTMSSSLEAGVQEGTTRMKAGSRYIQSWKNAVQSGSFEGTYDAWVLAKGAGNRVPSACPYISTLRLDKVLEERQLVNIRSRTWRPFLSREVLINGRDVGRAGFYFHPHMAPPEDLFMMYYNPDKGLLLFLEEDGTPLPETMGVDLLAKADHKGIRPLLLLAQAEGLIDKVPCGRLVSLDFQTHIDSGFYIRTNSQKDGLFQPAISLPGASRAFRFRMRSVDSQRTYLRFFPYIHDADETLRFWDVEAQEDLQLRIGRAGTSWAAWEIKRKIPELFDIARSQGYWKDFVDKSPSAKGLGEL